MWILYYTCVSYGYTSCIWVGFFWAYCWIYKSLLMIGIDIKTIASCTLWWTGDIFWTFYPTAADQLNDKLWATAETSICANRWQLLGELENPNAAERIAWNKKFTLQQIGNKQKITIKHASVKKHKNDVERRQTLGHPRSINPNMINHVPQQLPIIF